MMKILLKNTWLFVLFPLLFSACEMLPNLIPRSAPPVDPVKSIGQTKINPIDGMVMVYVPAGDFLMGSEDEEALEDEQPEHLVHLNAYWIYQTEVTNQQYLQCIKAGACSSSTRKDYPSDVHPVTLVFRRDGHKYCEWAGGRLPTEAEWEKAARGTDGRTFPWGNEPVAGDLANFCDVNCTENWADTSQDDGYTLTAPVGSYPAGASPYGALDMAGNAAEWVSDGYNPDFYSTSPYRNPKGPKGSGYAEITRGGSWFNREQSLRVTNRFSLEGAIFEDVILDTFGFRCVQDGH